MAKVYKLWFLNFTDPWYALGESKQNELMENITGLLPTYGARSLITCASNTEKWLMWGIEEFPDLGSQQKHSLALFNLNWFRYISSWSIMGTKIQPHGEVIIEKAPLYKAAIYRNTEAYSVLPYEQKKEKETHLNYLHEQFGSKVILACFTAWSDEEWLAFVLESYPSADAALGRHQKLYEMDWYRYVQATSSLGVRWPIE